MPEAPKTKELRKVLKPGRALGEHLGVVAALKKFALLDQYGDPIEELTKMLGLTNVGLTLQLPDSQKAKEHYMYSNPSPLGSGIFDRPEAYGGV
jgi:hypothetical protein